MITTFQSQLALFKRRLGMYVATGAYGEVCAFVDGLDLGSGEQVMTEFRTWLIARGAAHPELAWWFLVLGELYPGGQLPNLKQFSSAENDAAIAALFELLESYLNQRSQGA